ncbi:MAG: Hydrogenase-4 component D [Hydrogenibacillus schlegelii]|uniref:Hydrogenase-4 component D n=1 Tax=Hydrogenibacillus schlegelii TaxID=1484 RepID=A0A2T5G6T3_HYDSH|nr:hypothetical protein [Hydrogenibacillus schlegelii]PTQ51872.1 MAG: Hydrogenase-4 component D [Hydrogenibacillus schlegelii]
MEYIFFLVESILERPNEEFGKKFYLHPRRHGMLFQPYVVGQRTGSYFFGRFMIILAGFQVGWHQPLILVLMIVTLVESVENFIWILKWMGVNVFGSSSEAIAGASPTPVSIQFDVGALILMTLVSQYIGFLLLS